MNKKIWVFWNGYGGTEAPSISSGQRIITFEINKPVQLDVDDAVRMLKIPGVASIKPEK